MTTDTQINAWLVLNEDAPLSTNYNDPTSAYQAMIRNNVYGSTDMIFLCFATTTPTGEDTTPKGDGSFYTIKMEQGKHPCGFTNDDYTRFIIRDAKQNNPGIKIGITLEWGNTNVLADIFANKKYSDEENSSRFAANLTTFILNNDLDGFDVAWESQLCYTITSEQFSFLFSAIRTEFDAVKEKRLYLSLSPAEIGNLDVETVNESIDFVNLQLYYNPNLKKEFILEGICETLLAYGAKFESISGDDPVPYQNAIDVYTRLKEGNYTVITQWRLNSANFIFEQAQQVKLYKLIKSLEYAEVAEAV